MNLNKSAFVIALDCPRKLWYHHNAYPNLNNDNAFLKALAVEGQKFGAIARIYYGCDGATFDLGFDAKKNEQFVPALRSFEFVENLLQGFGDPVSVQRSTKVIRQSLHTMLCKMKI